MKNKTVGAIYYTDSRLEGHIIIDTCRNQIKKAFKGELVSTSLKPLDFGKNFVLEGRSRSYPTMVDQIVLALENLTTDYVFFLEHDVLYHETHFDFVPKEDNVFYYNSNVVRWRYGGDGLAIAYDGMLPLSCMCANRKFALDHYHMRQEKIKEWNLDDMRSREPRKSRIFGYEPGTKPKRRGGLTDDVREVWKSELPNIDIRHGRTFSAPKITLESFKHKPTGWKEKPADEIDGWNLNEMFNIK